MTRRARQRAKAIRPPIEKPDLKRYQAILKLHAAMAARGVSAPHQSTIIDPPRNEPFEIEFNGLPLTIEHGVFEPGPMSAAIVDALVSACAGVHAPIVADVGTGSGAIAIAFAMRRPDATVYALDVSPQAVVCAQNNARRVAAANVVILQGPLLQPLLEKQIQLSAISANLPYVPAAVAGVKELLRPNRWRGPRETVVGLDEDGLGLARALVKEAAQLMLPGASLIIEMEEWQTEIFAREYAQSYAITIAPNRCFITLTPAAELKPGL